MNNKYLNFLIQLTIFTSFFEFYGRVNFIPSFITPFRLSLFVCFVYFIFSILTNKVKINKIIPIDICIFCFLLVNIISFKNSINTDLFISKMLALSGFSFLYFLLSNQIFTKSFKKQLFKLFYLITII